MSATIEIDPGSGFCFGVVTAIRKAEEVLDSNGTLYCLGDIVHNSSEVERLRSRGLVTITHADLESLHDVKVLLRAHGEPPSTYETAKRNNIEIIDATCPVVLRLQQRIKHTFDNDRDTQIVIYGKNGHAEVNGLVGQTQGKAIVAENIDDLRKVDFSRNISLYSQTTKSPQGFRHMIDEINTRKADSALFEHFDTICRQVSSNGKVLCAECTGVNPRAHLIAGPEDIKPEWLHNSMSIGICGATSTPRWLMEDVKTAVSEILKTSCNG